MASVSEQNPTAKWRNRFEVTSTVLMIALGATVVWQGWDRSATVPPRSHSAVPVPSKPISIAARPVLGAPTAKVAVVAYSDFECPFCGVVARDTMPALIREYVDSGKVILAFKHLPLPMHSLAEGAAKSAVCAGQQNKFWQMHDRLFGVPLRLSEPDLRASAQQVDLDLAAYDSCRAGAAAGRVVEEDKSEAEALGITATPTFFFGVVRPNKEVRVTDVLTGAKHATEFKRILDRMLESGSPGDL